MSVLKVTDEPVFFFMSFIASIILPERVTVLASGCLVIVTSTALRPLYDAVPIAGDFPVVTVATSPTLTGSPCVILITELARSSILSVFAMPLTMYLVPYWSIKDPEVFRLISWQVLISSLIVTPWKFILYGSASI